MKTKNSILTIGFFLYLQLNDIFAFQGEIKTSLTRVGYIENVSYTVSSNKVRVARNENDPRSSLNIVDLQSGETVLIYPQSRSYMRIVSENKKSVPAGFPEMPMPPGGLPAGIGPQFGQAASLPQAAPSSQIGPANLPGMPAMDIAPRDVPEWHGKMPSQMKMLPKKMPHASMMMPTNQPGMAVMKPDATDMHAPPDGMHRPPPDGVDPASAFPMDGEPLGQRPPHHVMSRMRSRESRTLQFEATGQTTNMMGFACSGYTIRHRGLTLELWATDQLIPFHPWLQDAPPRHGGPRNLEESWGQLLQERNLFPLEAVLKNRSGDAVLFEFKVESIRAEEINETENTRFLPPADYMELPAPRF